MSQLSVAHLLLSVYKVVRGGHVDVLVVHIFKAQEQELLEQERV